MSRKLILSAIAILVAALVFLGWHLWSNGTFDARMSSHPPVALPQATTADGLQGKPVTLAMEHSGNTVTALSDGRVLIAGENGLELFDPVSGTVTHANGLVPSIWMPRYTALADGRVLATGGFVHLDKPLDNRVMDPRNGVVTVTGALLTPRQGHSATLLADGRVLIAGGEPLGEGAQPRKPFASAEVYDPASGKFTATGSLATARSEHAATLLADGRVLITGGLVIDDAEHLHLAASAEVYDPVTGTFSSAGNMIAPRTSHSATLLKNGKVLIVGGRVDPDGTEDGTLKGKELNDAELWDPTSSTFSVTGALASTRTGHTATMLDNGTVLVTGGAVGTGAPTASAWLYDPETQSFGNLGDMASARKQHTATLLPDGRVLIAGGSYEEGDGDYTLETCQFYDPKAQRFVAAPALKAGRDRHSAMLQPDGRVLFVGGWGGGAQIGDEWYDPTKGSGPAPPWFPIGRSGHAAIRLGDGRVLLAGGEDPNFKKVAQALLFDPATNKLSFTGSMKQARMNAGAARLADGRVLIVGGFGNGSHATPLASAEVYDPKNGGFSLAGNLKVKRAEARVAPLPDGRVLVVGGNSRDVDAGFPRVGATAEIWNPATNSFSDTSPPVASRDGASATPLANGMVLVVGGEMSPDSAEVYNPKSGNFSLTGSPVVPRHRHIAVALEDGRVLVAGGEGSTQDSTDSDGKIGASNSAEIYTPASGGFAGGFNFEQIGTITYLVQIKDGRLLVVGDSGAGLFELAQLPNPAKESHGSGMNGTNGQR